MFILPYTKDFKKSVDFYAETQENHWGYVLIFHVNWVFSWSERYLVVFDFLPTCDLVEEGDPATSL